ncbi:MAG TPA: adenylate/guanylate cyclase domain-containing protein [Candidatus Baltobacteraceae bacterium]|nr:adenylate/guanylate cyclase domain-containing protein [Candidatus Baltobacteraceae bacterium]
MALARTWTWEFPASRERLWTYLGDTDWVNEHAGLPRITARYEPLPEGGTRRMASFRRWPFTVEWEERPTSWQAPEFHEVDRHYTRGPLRRFRSRTSLDARTPERTRVRMDIDLDAASPLFEPLLPFIAAQGKAGAARAFSLAAKLAAQTPLPQQTDAQRALDEFLQTAEDRDVRRMRPYELADRWHLPRRDVLRAFLSATRAGTLNLRWSVLCPGCRGAVAGVDTLAALQRGNHCEACNISFDAAFDRSVEVTFDARPMRPNLQEEALFCIASPQRSAHVHAQRAVAPGGTISAEIPLAPGSYDVNAVGLHTVPFIVSRDEAPARDLSVHIAPQAITVPECIASGDVRVSIENATADETLVRIEDGRWPDTVVTAAQVTALQEFRDLFSSEVLAPGLELGIETIAVLFTDLVGSTAMYSRTGDAPAFRIVTEHFAVIREIVARYEGALVKTIGDAVMAVFVNPANCFKAAIELDSKVQSVTCGGVPLRLRVGMHAGPCIAMRANERIDYFGTTVNLAARLESLAGAGEVTMARADAQRTDIAPLVAAFTERTTAEHLPIKGFAQPIDVVRLRVL